MPSGGGVGTARGIAHAYGAFAAGERDLGCGEDTGPSGVARDSSHAGFFDECMKVDGVRFRSAS